jgi:hypothetical protein
MRPDLTPSEYRVAKHRADALLTLSSGQSMMGCVFVAGGSARHTGPERVGELLNSTTGFFPFEIHDAGSVRTVLINRQHLVMAALAENEASYDPGYDLATERTVSILMSSGLRVVGAVRVYQPEGRDRLSDWGRQPEVFRYVETADTTLIVNMAHVVEVSEVFER